MNKYIILLFSLLLGVSCDDSSKSSNSEVQQENEATQSHHDSNHNHTDDAPKISVMKQKEALVKDGYQIFEMVDEASQDTLLMQQYFMAFLKMGPNRDQSQEEAENLQIEHLNHLKRMYDLGYADISGPFGDEGEARGITIYNVPNLEMADSLANSDPAVKAGRLEIEIRPWWAAKGFKLR